MKLVVMGTGGVGGYFGARLARSGADVTFVARGAHLEAIRARGLTVRSAAAGEFVIHARAVADLTGHALADAVLFCVKSFDTESAAEALRAVVGPETAVLSLQNGVDNEEKIDAVLGAGHAVGGAAYVFATIDSPGIISQTLGGTITFGELDGVERPRTRRLLDAFAAAGVPAELSADIRRVLWEKYLLIAAQAGMSTLARVPIGVIRAIPETWKMYRGIVEELAALAAAEKVGLSADVVDRIMSTAGGLGAGAMSSMHHDLVHGRRLELEALHGHAVRLGERLGVPTPAVFAVYAALKPHAAPAPAGRSAE
jgi:2-dehydropantoate 2-reductase